MSDKTRIAIGCDHAALSMKVKLRDTLRAEGYEVLDQGTDSTASVDYPDFARKVAEAVASGQADFGVMICATGLGTAMTANKVAGVRAAPCNNTLSASFSRSHNNANVLTLGARLIDATTAQKILHVWLNTKFEGGRHQRRVDKIHATERKSLEEKRP